MILFNNVFIPHKIQGLAIGFIPKYLNIDIIDEMISVNESEAIDMMKNLTKLEGLCLGISSAANIVACLKVAGRFKDKKNIVTLAYDSGNHYLEYF